MSVYINDIIAVVKAVNSVLKKLVGIDNIVEILRSGFKIQVECAIVILIVGVNKNIPCAFNNFKSYRQNNLIGLLILQNITF